MSTDPVTVYDMLAMFHWTREVTGPNPGAVQIGNSKK